MRWWNDWCASVDIDPCDGPDHCSRWNDLMHPDDLAGEDELYRAVADGRSEEYEAEHRMRTRSGRWRWVMTRGRVVERDAHGRATRIVGVAVDIDARKRAELALRAAEQQLELAIQGAQLPVWTWDLKRDCVRANHHWYRAIGIDISPAQAERLEEPWLLGIHPDDVAALQAAVAAHVSGARDFYEGESRFQTADGSWKWFLDRGKVVEWDESGAPRILSGVAIDIDER
jgi:PAS domain S-box-containing protein